jgi:hypothetical protein
LWEKQIEVFKEEEMDALLESYLHGLKCLKEEVKANGGDYGSLDLLQMRLKENIDARMRGDTKDNQAQRMEILASLNGHTRNLYSLSFDDYCQQCGQRSFQVMPIAATVQNMGGIQDVAVTIEGNTARNAEQLVTPSDLPPIVEQAFILLAHVNGYIATLQENVQKAKGVFNDKANIGQEQCRAAFSLFCLFDYRNFPDYNSSLFRAKTRLQHLNEQINALICLCEICDDVDRYAKLNAKKVQNLIGILDSLYYEIGSIQNLLSSVDISYKE